MERAIELATAPSMPNVLFHGPTGSGKRCAVDAMLDKIYGDCTAARREMVMYVDCAEGRGLSVVREEIKHFAQTQVVSPSNKRFKVIVLLDGDHLSPDAQSALRRCIEIFSHSTRFVMLASDPRKILLPILSRFCQVFCRGPEREGEWHRRDVANRSGTPPWDGESTSRLLSLFSDAVSSSAPPLAIARRLVSLGYCWEDLERLDVFAECSPALCLDIHSAGTVVTSEALLIAYAINEYRTYVRGSG